VDDFFNEYNKILSLVDLTRKYKLEYKQYFKGFLSNLKMIIYILNDNLKKAEIEKINTFNIRMSSEEFDLFEYSYPVYDEYKMEEFFDHNRFYYNISKEKKVFIIKYLKNITEDLKKEL